MLCVECGAKDAEAGSEICFLCRVRSVGFSWRGGAMHGQSGFHRTKREYMEEHLGTTDERALAERGIERAP